MCFSHLSATSVATEISRSIDKQMCSNNIDHVNRLIEFQLDPCQTIKFFQSGNNNRVSRVRNTHFLPNLTSKLHFITASLQIISAYSEIISK